MSNQNNEDNMQKDEKSKIRRMSEGSIIAIVTIIATSLVSIFSTCSNSNTALETEKLQRETQLILNVFGMKDKKEAAKSLEFFVDTGFLRDPKGKIKELAKDPDRIPSISKFSDFSNFSTLTIGSETIDLSAIKPSTLTIDFSDSLLLSPKKISK